MRTVAGDTPSRAAISLSAMPAATRRSICSWRVAKRQGSFTSVSAARGPFAPRILLFVYADPRRGQMWAEQCLCLSDSVPWNHIASIATNRPSSLVLGTRSTQHSGDRGTKLKRNTPAPGGPKGIRRIRCAARCTTRRSRIRRAPVAIPVACIGSAQRRRARSAHCSMCCRLRSCRDDNFASDAPLHTRRARRSHGLLCKQLVLGSNPGARST